ncbi:MAG TPA: ADP-ribosylation factor-like protein [Thermoanaerobaculia bacterium]|nr:ADP-ribosylation factor-like protein [Thermoanaerobaculia bacterium]
MVVYNAATRELTAKIVYYGPGLGGKTTNLQVLHDRLDPATVGKLLNLATQTDRTIYFDLLPVELGDIKGYKIRFQLATVPGQTAFNETRRVVLKGSDGIVFVADSQWTMLPKNLESWQNLKENLKANGVSFEGIPIVVQYNKRDLTDILSVDALQEALGLSSYPFVEAVASAGRGVTETFKLISKLTFVDLLRRLQGRRPEDAPAPPVPVRKDKDDLLSWKDSLLNRSAAASGATAAAAQAKRPLSLVQPGPAEEPPFEAADEGQAPAEPPAEAEGPFVEAASTPAAPPELPAVPPAPPAAPVAAAEISSRPTERIEYVDPVEVARRAAPLFPSSAATTPLPEAPAFAASAEPPALFVDPPQLEMPSPPPPPAPVFDDTRMRELEERLARAEGSLARERTEKERLTERMTELTAELSTRLETFEKETRALGERQDGFSQRVDTLEKANSARHKETLPRVQALEDRLDRGEKRQRTAEDDVSMALRTLSERGEKLHQHIEEIGEKIAALERTLQEKTSQTRREADDIRSQLDTFQGALEEKIMQGRREAEDIRSQIAPVLEAHGRQGETSQRLTAEFDRMRESLAEALGEVSERLRNAVRGL